MCTLVRTLENTPHRIAYKAAEVKDNIFNLKVTYIHIRIFIYLLGMSVVHFELFRDWGLAAEERTRQSHGVVLEDGSSGVKLLRT